MKKIAAMLALVAGTAASATPVAITHSASQTVVIGNSVACNVQTPFPQTTVINHYWRTFHLGTFGIHDSFQVTGVEVGVEEAVGPDGTGRQTLEVRLYNDPTGADPILGELVQVGEAQAIVTDQRGTRVTIPVAGVVPAGGTLVVEVMSRDLRGNPPRQTGGRFYIGSNRAGQTAPGYFSAPQCSYPQLVLPETIAPGIVMHYVMTVFGDSGGCYADCDQSTGVGVLDIFDFLCFQNLYDARAPYACDCDTLGGGGVCDIFDFLCFQNAFANGCP